MRRIRRFRSILLRKPPHARHDHLREDGSVLLPLNAAFPAISTHTHSRRNVEAFRRIRMISNVDPDDFSEAMGSSGVRPLKNARSAARWKVSTDILRQIRC